MEHIVQFAIGIDDDAIKKSIAAHAEEQIIKELVHEVKKHIYKTSSSYYNRDAFSTELTDYMNNKIDNLLESCKGDIIEKAAEKLADRLARSKAARELIPELAGKAEEE